MDCHTGKVCMPETVEQGAAHSHQIPDTGTCLQVLASRRHVAQMASLATAVDGDRWPLQPARVSAPMTLDRQVDQVLLPSAFPTSVRGSLAQLPPHGRNVQLRVPQQSRERGPEIHRPFRDLALRSMDWAASVEHAIARRESHNRCTGRHIRASSKRCGSPLIPPLLLLLVHRWVESDGLIDDAKRPHHHLLHPDLKQSAGLHLLGASWDDWIGCCTDWCPSWWRRRPRGRRRGTRTLHEVSQCLQSNYEPRRAASRKFTLFAPCFALAKPFNCLNIW